MERAETILQFWFGDPEDATGEYGQQRKVWFNKDPAFDRTIRQLFLGDYEQAVAGELKPWRDEPYSCLALVLLLDQFPRNLFRGDRRSFASDCAARDTV